MGLDQLDNSVIYAICTVALTIISILLTAGWYSEYLTRCDYEQAFHDEYEDSMARKRENDKLITQLKYYKQLVDEVTVVKTPRKTRK